jgi:hypothetical protein
LFGHVDAKRAPLLGNRTGQHLVFVRIFPYLYGLAEREFTAFLGPTRENHSRAVSNAPNLDDQENQMLGATFKDVCSCSVPRVSLAEGRRCACCRSARTQPPTLQRLASTRARVFVLAMRNATVAGPMKPRPRGWGRSHRDRRTASTPAKAASTAKTMAK